MAIANVASGFGTQTATLGTEHTLVDTATVGTFVLLVNTTNLANGETLTLKVYNKVLSADSYDLAWSVTYKHVQGQKIVQSVPIVGLFGAKFTLTQAGGTGRAFKWSVVQIG